QII
ncbi:unnamed protein product, partial [Acanthoscelides obtectus]